MSLEVTIPNRGNNRIGSNEVTPIGRHSKFKVLSKKCAITVVMFFV
jgi:hypothetical protein